MKLTDVGREIAIKGGHFGIISKLLDFFIVNTVEYILWFYICVNDATFCVEII